jgi:molybdopterin-guanine dinucleotide biosynthesis protein A
MLATISAALLTGGASSRMGRDKAHLEIDGLPVASGISRLLAGLFEDVLIVGEGGWRIPKGRSAPSAASRARSPPPRASVCWWWRRICRC